MQLTNANLDYLLADSSHQASKRPMAAIQFLPRFWHLTHFDAYEYVYVMPFIAPVGRTAISNCRFGYSDGGSYDLCL